MQYPEYHNYVPSPILFEFEVIYSALANASGRMQYFKEKKDTPRIRIGRGEFIQAFNNLPILAVRPIQSNAPVFQLMFYA